MVPEIAVALSQPCGRFFHEADFEFAYFKEDHCPHSRVIDVGDEQLLMVIPLACSEDCERAAANC